jgi:hypothetical protein
MIEGGGPNVDDRFTGRSFRVGNLFDPHTVNCTMFMNNGCFHFYLFGLPGGNRFGAIQFGKSAPN